MIWVIVLVGLLLLLVIYILTVPFRLQISTARDLYRFSISGFGYVRIVPTDNLFNLRFRILFYSREVELFKESDDEISQSPRSKKGGTTAKKQKEGDPQKRSRFRLSKKRRRWLLRKALRIPSTFKINLLHLEVDTGDYIKNAYLFPLFASISREPVNLHVNYEEINSLDLDVENRVYRVLKVFII